MKELSKFVSYHIRPHQITLICHIQAKYNQSFDLAEI